MLINTYVPNAGDRSSNGERTAFKVRFLAALKEKCDALVAAGRQVLQYSATIGHPALLHEIKEYSDLHTVC